jgi:hypothetical protein
MSRQQQNSERPAGKVVNWPLIVCHFLGLPLELVLHNVKTFGVRSVGPRAGGALLVMFLFVAFHPDENVRPLIWFMIAVVPLSIAAQISATLRLWRGQQSHTRYSGRPYAMWVFPYWNEVTIKRLEPIVTWVVGAIIYRFNHPLGSFVVCAATGVAVKIATEFRGNRTRNLDMSDAVIDQRIAMEGMRGVEGRSTTIRTQPTFYERS